MSKKEKGTADQEYIEGFVIQSAEGLYLSRHHEWVEHENGTKAFVHEDIGEIFKVCGSWTVKPARMRAAIYNPEPQSMGTTIYGLPIKISV